MIKSYFIFLFLCLITLNTKAQNPNWSVNTASYQYSMTFTSFLNIDGRTLTSLDDTVAAIVNDEIRGVSSVEYVASLNKYVTYLSVFANTDNETISFKIYDSTNDNVIDVVKNQDFIIDGNIGGILQSFSIAKPALNAGAILNSFAFSGVTSTSQTITNNKIDIVLPFETNLTNLIVDFSLSDGASFLVDNEKQTSGVSKQDFTNPVIYKVLSEDESKLIAYEVNVTIETESSNPSEIVLTSDFGLFVNKAPLLINLETSTPLTNLLKETISVTNAIVLSVEKNNDLNYSIQIVPIQQGEFSIELPKNSVQSTGDVGNLASNKLVFNYDIVNPYVLSTKRNNPIDEITDNDTLEFIVIFSEAVENVSVTDFESVSDSEIALTKETDSKYIVTITNIDDIKGAVSLNIKETNSIKDKASNVLLNSVINPHQN
ncbi:hypothetical protein [Polaribacter sp. Asnod6-C07]|uniref:hypothetical protein n=1 Tax=Polaribacter sp. Asnod6-C07 TaxID=3160582 RepID=UPI003863C05F